MAQGWGQNYRYETKLMLQELLVFVLKCVSQKLNIITIA
jgi:hypothetical protein